MSVIALESNPRMFNLIIGQLGFEGVEFHELLGFEPDMISMVPEPHLAMIFCYPYQERAFEYRKNIYKQLEASGKDTVPNGVIFSQQNSANSCGYFSICHAIFNNLGYVHISDDGFFAKMIGMNEKEESGVSPSPEESSSESLAAKMMNCFNNISLNESEAAMPERIDYHFIVYSHHDGHLFEFDSLQKFPRDCGPSSGETLLADAGNICKELMDHLDVISCNALVLSAKEN